MSAEVVALGGGIFFVLVAIVGGGLTIRELVIPRVPHWARAAAGVFGLLLLLPFVLTVVDGRTDRDVRSASDTGSDQPPAPERGAGGIELDTEPQTTDDDVRISGLAATVRNDPPRVGDTVTVEYSLTNVGTDRLPMEYTFVGARDPADENRDSEDENENRTLEPGETIQASGRIFLDDAGTWLIFPCYLLAGDRYCPEEWKAFNLIAEQRGSGTVMVIDDDGGLRTSETAYDRRVAGVVSGAGELRPGVILDQHAEDTGRITIGLAGKLYCKVDADHAPVRVGDLLTTSATRGHAMTVADTSRATGAVLGKALRALPKGQGILPILIALL